MRVGVLSLCVLLSCVCGDIQAKKMYRWVDAQGNVHFSDQVPPDQIQQKRDTLNEKARVVDTVDKAKTPEQIEQQKRLDALRKEQEKIIAKQASDDKVLLTTYRSSADIQRALDTKFLEIDSNKNAVEGNLKRYEQQLSQQWQEAATHERNARKVPAKLLEDIAVSKRQIEMAQVELARHDAEKQKFQKEFQADMARFQFLTQNADDTKVSQTHLAASNANNELGLFVCQTTEQCLKAWQIAGEFVAKFSSTGPDVENENLIMRAVPVTDSDISLSISRLQQGKTQQIFLDMRCKNTNLGQELCASDKAQTIRRGFAHYVQSQLTSQ